MTPDEQRDRLAELMHEPRCLAATERLQREHRLTECAVREGYERTAGRLYDAGVRVGPDEGLREAARNALVALNYEISLHPYDEDAPASVLEARDALTHAIRPSKGAPSNAG